MQNDRLVRWKLMETNSVKTNRAETDPVENDSMETDSVKPDLVETDSVETDPVETYLMETRKYIYIYGTTEFHVTLNFEIWGKVAILHSHSESHSCFNCEA